MRSEGHWCLVEQTNAPAEQFALSPGDWRERRLTLATVQDAGDATVAVYRRVPTRWLEWLAQAVCEGTVDSERVTSQAPEAAMAIGAGPDSAAWAGAAAGSELGREAWRLRRFTAEPMRAFAASLPAKSRDALTAAWDVLDGAEAFEEAGPSSEERAEVWRKTGTWPADLAVVQLSGGARWGAYRKYEDTYGWCPPLVDERFEAVVRAVAGEAGFQAVPIDVRDRDWKPRITHKALLVSGDFPWMEWLDDTSSETEEGEYVDGHAAAPDAMREGDHPGLLWGMYGLYARPDVAAALRNAKLPGVTLSPLRYESERG